MSGRQTPPLKVSTAHCERLDAERLMLRLTGTWHDASAATQRLTLIVDGNERRLRFPALPRPRQAVGAAAPRFDARFTVPASLEPDLDGRMTLLVGEAAVDLPPLQSVPEPEPEPEPEPKAEAGGPPPAAAVPVGGDTELLAALREELARRARVEGRLRAELAALRARVDTRAPAAERLETVRRELADELVRVRRTVEAHEQRRGEVESRAMVLAAELSELQHSREQVAAELEARREECEMLTVRVSELEAEVAAARREAVALRTAELSARAGQEAALAEVAALHDELDRLAAGSPADAEAGDAELERAEALLAEARALTASLG